MRDALQALRAELPHRLAAGARGADDRLRRHGGALRRLGARVPACARLADAVERAAGPGGGTTALLDLLGLVRQAAAALAASGVEGELEALPPDGPWATPAESVGLEGLAEVLDRSGSGRERALEEAVQRGAIADLRLVGPLLRCLGDRHAPFADLVADKALPAFGPTLATELELGTDPDGGPAAARCLRALCRVDAEAGRQRCRELLRGADEVVRVQALESLAKVDAGRSVDEALRCLRDKSAKVRGAAYWLLAAAAKAGQGPALEALLSGLGESDAVWVRIRPAFFELKADEVRQRLETDLQRALEAPGSKSRGGRGAAAPERIACRLVEVLGNREERARSRPVLLPLARKAPTALRAAALRALGKGGLGPGVLEAALAGLREGPEEVAYAAVFALHWNGPAAAEAAPALKPVIENTAYRDDIRTFAVQAFGAVAPRDRASVDYLVGLLRAERPDTLRWYAAQALAKFGEAARPALPAIGEMFLETPDCTLPYYLGETLLALDPDGSFAVPLLVGVLTGPRECSEYRGVPALRTLERYGGRARAAIPAVEAVIAEGPSAWRCNAALALDALRS